MYTLQDEQVCNFLEGEPAVDYKRRLVGAKLTGEAEYQKELLIISEHKKQRMMQAKKDEETKRLKEMAKYDNLERKHMKVDETRSKNLKFGSNTTTCKDMGIGVQKPGKQGGG